MEVRVNMARCLICGHPHSNDFHPHPDGEFIFNDIPAHKDGTLCKDCMNAWITDDKEYMWMKMREKLQPNSPQSGREGEVKGTSSSTSTIHTSPSHSHQTKTPSEVGVKEG